MSGLIIPHDHFGTHFDNNTVDEELELAGEILAELWSKLVINDHPAGAEFLGEEPSDIIITKSEKWKANHIR